MSTKIANLAKQIVGATINLAMMAKKKQLEKYLAKPNKNKKCFNYGKKDYYARNCHISNKKKPKDSLKKVKRAWQKKSQAKTATARLTTKHNNSNAKPYLAGQVFITRTDERQLGV